MELLLSELSAQIGHLFGSRHGTMARTTHAFYISHNNYCLLMIVIILHPSSSDPHSPYATLHPVLPFYTSFQEAAQALLRSQLPHKISNLPLSSLKSQCHFPSVQVLWAMVLSHVFLTMVQVKSRSMLKSAWLWWQRVRGPRGQKQGNIG